jgi:hypothetical protein
MRWGVALSAMAGGCVGAFWVFYSFSVPARAADQYTILGAGGRPCGSWLLVRSQALPDSAVLQSWVLGYITSVNANLLTSTGDVTAGASPEALFSWIDNYCEAHPLESLARVTSALLDSLLVKNKAK